MIWSHLTKDQIYEWKKQWWAVFSVSIADHDFVYRQLSQREFNTVRETYNLIEEQEEAICKICTLYPKDFPFSSTYAGIPTALSEAIRESSGMLDSKIVQDTLAVYREQMKTLDNQLSCIIVEAFPKLSIEEVEEWPLNKALWYLSRAEYTLNGLRQELKYGPFSYQTYDPEQSVTQTAPVQAPVRQRERQPQPAPREEVIEQNINILEDPAFDRDLLNPEIAKNKKTELNGSMADFPELSEINSFMKGKWKPR